MPVSLFLPLGAPESRATFVLVCPQISTSSSINKNPPRMPRGETVSRFFERVCRVKAGGKTVPGIPSGDSWSFGLRRRIGLSPAKDGIEGIRDALRRDSLLRRVFEVREVPPRRSTINSSPGASLHPAGIPRRCVRLFAKPRPPSRPVGETSGIPIANLADFPSVLHPEGLRFLGVQLSWFAH